MQRERCAARADDARGPGCLECRQDEASRWNRAEFLQSQTDLDLCWGALLFGLRARMASPSQIPARTSRGALGVLKCRTRHDSRTVLFRRCSRVGRKPVAGRAIDSRNQGLLGARRAASRYQGEPWPILARRATGALRRAAGSAQGRKMKRLLQHSLQQPLKPRSVWTDRPNRP